MSNKHVLIVTYYWPPAGGPGVQRWLKFCKYLPENDITPIVYCPENPNYPILDSSLLNDIPDSLEVLNTRISEPYKFAKLLSQKKTKAISSGIITKSSDQNFLERLMLFVRGNFFIPDARKDWVKPSVSYLSEVIKARSLNCVITTGPPHSLHLIGLELKRKLNIKWLADFRDPWTSIGYHKSLKLLPASKNKHKKLELQVLNTADEIIVTSEYTKREFENKTKQPIRVITNGYDTHDISIDSLDDVFSISHIGSLLSDRNPSIFWEVLSELIRDNEDFKSSLQLNLVGVTSEDIIEDIRCFGLSENLNVVGYVSHRDAIKHQMTTQLLLLVEIDSEDTKAIIPGKLFEYLQAERPILAIGPKDSDVETIISETNSGNYFNYDSKEALKLYILKCFNQFKKGQLLSHPVRIQKYSRRELTKQLATLIKKHL